MSDDLVVRRFEEGSELTLHVTGDLDIVSARQLAEHAASVVGVAHVHLDLSGVPFLDVKGAQGLEHVVQAARAEGAAVSVIGASEAHLRLLALMGLVDFSDPS